MRKNVKNINLRIRSDCTVAVSANNAVPTSVIEEFLRKKTNYILTAIDTYRERAKYALTEHNYMAGESFRYLGKELRLKLIQGKNSVTSDGVYLYLTVPDVQNAGNKEMQITRWYDQQCRVLFLELIDELYPVFRKYGVPSPALALRNMTSRWGSCQPKRRMITLNKILIEAPRNCIEYVVMHEFIHFLHPNHSKKFYDLLSALVPDWRERKNTLENVNNSRIQKGI
jgi:predicted metal-dependent hydrolase